MLGGWSLALMANVNIQDIRDSLAILTYIRTEVGAIIFRNR